MDLVEGRIARPNAGSPKEIQPFLNGVMGEARSAAIMQLSSGRRAARREHADTQTRRSLSVPEPAEPERGDGARMLKDSTTSVSRRVLQSCGTPGHGIVWLFRVRTRLR